MSRTSATTGTLNRLSSDTFEGNVFDSQSATTRNVVLSAGTSYIAVDTIEIGSTFSLEIPSTSSLEITAYYSPGSVIPNTQLNYPVKFSVYRNAAQNTGNAAFAQINFDTKEYDTGNNYDNVSSFNFTAPYAGYYQFFARCSVQTGTALIISLYKNSSEYKRGGDMGGGARAGVTLSPPPMLLAQGDTINIQSFGSAALALDVGQTYYTYFGGYLLSLT